MDDPELQGDEQILIRTQGVHVKSISFEAILTNRGIILVDRLKNLLPPKEIPLTTIQSIEPGENAIRDLTITLGVITKAGGARQMVLTFSREGGGNRIKERDEWVRQIRGYIIPSFEQVIRKVIPGIDPQEAGHEDTAPFGIRAAVPLARSPDLSQPAKKIMENPPEPWNPAPSPERHRNQFLAHIAPGAVRKCPRDPDSAPSAAPRLRARERTPRYQFQLHSLLFLYLHPKKSARSTATSVLLTHSLRDQRRLFLSIRSRQPIPCQREFNLYFLDLYRPKWSSRNKLPQPKFPLPHTPQRSALCQNSSPQKTCNTPR